MSAAEFKNAARALYNLDVELVGTRPGGVQHIFRVRSALRGESVLEAVIVMAVDNDGGYITGRLFLPAGPA